jgi:transcriptional regulator with XRE-family HTH domain
MNQFNRKRSVGQVVVLQFPPEVSVMTPFQKYLFEQVRLRAGGNIRAFARTLGVSHNMLLRVLDERDPQEPTKELLFRLAAAGIGNLRDLIVMVAPDEVTGEKAEVIALAARIEALDEDSRKQLDIFLSGLSLNHPKERAEN